MSSRASHVKYRFLAYNLEPVSFSTTAAYSSVFAVWGAIRFTSLYKNAVSRVPAVSKANYMAFVRILSCIAIINFDCMSTRLGT